MKGKILIVDDNEDVLLSLNMLLRPHVEAIRVLKEPERIDEFMDSFAPDVIILDMNFRRDASSGEEGYYWLAHILKRDPHAVVLFITAFVDTEKAVRAIKAGAVDFIPKPWDKAKLLGVVESAIQLKNTPPQPSPQGEGALSSLSTDDSSQSSTNKGINKTLSPCGEGGGGVFIGSSPSIEHLRSQIAIVAPTDANILITGENGTGKDVVAHLIHAQSQRSGREMVTIDLGSVPESLFESELFGYEKGAFTDAKTAKAGRVEQADGSTLFLDEIGNLSHAMQQKLLTVIEKRQISRIGSTKTTDVNVRLVCATNANLQQRAGEGTFRQDLLYRINTIVLHLPPLRERGNDILLLADHFAAQMAKRYNKPIPTFTDEAKQRLLAYHWPGNVRELQHVIERAVILTPPQLSPAGEGVSMSLLINNIDLPSTNDATSTNNDSSTTLNLASLERQAIMQAIERSNGNLTAAAELLGITRYALYRKIERIKLKL